MKWAFSKWLSGMPASTTVFTFGLIAAIGAVSPSSAQEDVCEAFRQDIDAISQEKPRAFRNARINIDRHIRFKKFSLGTDLHIEELPCPNLAKLIIDQKLHVSLDPGTRTWAITSLAVLSYQDSLIAEALIEGLAEPLFAKLSGPERAWRRRIDKLKPGISKTIGPEGEYPALQNTSIVRIAAIAAAQLEPTFRESILDIIQPGLHRQFYISGTPDGVIYLIAQSPKKHEIATQLFDWADKGAPRYAKVLVRLLATIEGPSDKLLTRTKAACEDAPLTSARSFDQRTCDVIFGRWGDQGAIRRLEQRIHMESTQIEIINAGSSALYLLFDIGKPGFDILRRALFSKSLSVAKRAAIPLCQLGLDAGEEIVKRVDELSDELPNDEQMARIAARCHSPQRSPMGEFFHIP